MSTLILFLCLWLLSDAGAAWSLIFFFALSRCCSSSNLWASVSVSFRPVLTVRVLALFLLSTGRLSASTAIHCVNPCAPSLCRGAVIRPVRVFRPLFVFLYGISPIWCLKLYSSCVYLYFHVAYYQMGTAYALSPCVLF